MTLLHDDDERALARALGGPAEPPRRNDAAFARAVLSEADARRSRRSPFALPAWIGAGVAAAFALFLALPSTTPADEWTPDALSTYALLDEDLFGYADAFDDGSLASLYDLEDLEDEELLGLLASLDEALSL